MLETIWFIIWGVLWAVYFMLDGFDLGVATVAPFITRDEREKRALYRSIGPFWDGNEVWLITAGGVTFAAFPGAYAVLFSSFYTPLMLILFGLILRAIGLEFRHRMEGRSWNIIWNACSFSGSLVPAVLFGVAFANIFMGISIDREGVFLGSLSDLLNPYGLAGGVFFLALFVMHGLLWLAIKTGNGLQTRAAAYTRGCWVALLVIAVIFLALTARYTDLFTIYVKYPALFILPVFSVGSLVVMRVFIARLAWWKAWFTSCLLIVSVTLFGVIGLYPRILPSSVDPAFSVTVFNSASSPLTLKIMLAVALVFVPIVIIYQGYFYRFFKDPVTGEKTDGDEVY